MSGLLLKIILSNKKTVKSALDYCKDKSICQKNKDVFSKKLLTLSGYKTFPSGTNVVEIYNELAQLSAKKSLFERNDIESLIKITEEFKIIISRNGSEQLKSFLMANGFVIPAYSSKIQTIKRNILDAKSRLESIYAQNPELVQRAIAAYPEIVNQLQGSSSAKRAYPKTPSPKRKSVKTSRK